VLDGLEEALDVLVAVDVLVALELEEDVLESLLEPFFLLLFPA
jgi:hypothetical protein